MNSAEIQTERRLMPAPAIRNNSKHLFWRAPWLNQSQIDSLDSHPSASVAYLVLFFPVGSWAMDLLESKWIWVGTLFCFPFLWVIWFEIWNEVLTWWLVWDWAWILLAGRNLEGLYCQKRSWSGAGLQTEQTRQAVPVRTETGLYIYQPGLISLGFRESSFQQGTCGILAGLY